MKKLLATIALCLAAFLVTACKHPVKETEFIIKNVPVNTDDITKNVFTDRYGDKMEVMVNNTKNTITIHLDGKTYELRKNEDQTEYTASNAEYQYSDIKGNVTFLKKGVDIVLFQHKKDPSAANMASSK